MQKAGYTGYIREVDVDGVHVFVPFHGTSVLLQQEITECSVWFDDGRMLSSEQRRKIFALVRDITAWVSGYSGKERVRNETLRMLQLNYLIEVSPENVRYQLEERYCALQDIDLFSLSERSPDSIDMSTARDFIDWMVELCISNGIPCQDTLLNRCEDIGRYVYACLWHKKCALCGKKTELHHVDAVGMGRNRKEICHLGYRVLPLCNIHHRECHDIGRDTFLGKYHLEPVRLDGRLCKVYGIKGGGEG